MTNATILHPSTTRIGKMRDRYALTVEPRPSRFTDPEAYAAWAARADAYAADEPSSRFCPIHGAGCEAWSL